VNDKWVKRWLVKSESQDGYYTVGQDKAGSFACSCRGWTHHTPRTHCKHITALLLSGGTGSETVIPFGEAVIGRMLGTLKGERL
jgi:hypothetical protein